MIRHASIVLLAFALAGCATTDAGRNGGSYAGAYDGGYYVAAQDGFGDYYYDRPQVAPAYDPWLYGDPYATYGFGFSYWGYGYGPWYPYPPGFGHHHGWHQPWTGPTGFHHTDAPDSGSHMHQNRAPRHDSRHPGS